MTSKSRVTDASFFWWLSDVKFASLKQEFSVDFNELPKPDVATGIMNCVEPEGYS